MALRCSSLCQSAALAILLLVLAMEPNGAYGSARGRHFWPKPPKFRHTKRDLGICASAIAVHGYKCQEVYVTTKDGFVLNVQRITEGRNGVAAGTNKPPVIVQHGVMCDSMTWYVNHPHQNLPMILADNGFDVWVTNTRGTRYSRRHTSLDPEQKAFWQWSWDELVTYEMPAYVEHVYSVTGQKVHYVGHSLGTLVGYVTSSERTLTDKLQSLALLSPIVYLSHMTTIFGNLAAKTMLAEAFMFLGIAEFNLGGESATKLTVEVCSNPEINCFDMMTAITGQNCCLNSSTAAMFLKNYPQSTSTRNLYHLAQTVRTGVLTKFDYVIPELNMKHYGTAEPPAYNLSHVPNDLPIFIGYGGRDALADTRDVATLLNVELKHHAKDKLTIKFIDNYAHQDFVMAVNARELVYEPLVSFFKHHQQP